jgi:hypothetical protein
MVLYLERKKSDNTRILFLRSDSFSKQVMAPPIFDVFFTSTRLMKINHNNNKGN